MAPASNHGGQSPPGAVIVLRSTGRAPRATRHDCVGHKDASHASAVSRRECDPAARRCGILVSSRHDPPFPLGPPVQHHPTTTISMADHAMRVMITSRSYHDDVRVAASRRTDGASGVSCSEPSPGQSTFSLRVGISRVPRAPLSLAGVIVTWTPSQRVSSRISEGSSVRDREHPLVEISEGRGRCAGAAPMGSDAWFSLGSALRNLGDVVARRAPERVVMGSLGSRPGHPRSV